MDGPTVAAHLSEGGPGRRIPGWRVVSVLLGLLLLTAAGLKGYDLATRPTPPATGLLDSRPFLIALVETELLLGLWLLSGVAARAAWAVALACFSAFALVAGYKAFTGEASCGCFGGLHVNPKWTLLLDVAAVTCLLLWPPRETDPRPSGSRAGVLAVAALFLAAGAGAAMALYRPATLRQDGDVLGDAQIVVLEPEQWKGKRCPLLNHIDVGPQLARGRWTLVLYHHDCPHCLEAMPRYERAAREASGKADAPRVALIEMPPYGPPGAIPIPPDSPCVRGKLSNSREWFATTPLEISLADGTTVGG